MSVLPGLAGITGAVPSYLPQSTALFAEMTTAPTTERKGEIDTFIRALVTGGVWDKLDLLYVLAAATEQAALLNWVTPGTYTLAKTSTPTFTADQGFDTTAGGQRLTAAWNPTDEGVNIALDDAFFAYRLNENIRSDSAPDVNFGNTYANAWNTSINNNTISLNSGNIFGSPPSTTLGFFAYNRTGSTNFSMELEDTSFGTATSTSTSLGTTDLALLQNASETATRREMSFFCVGGSLTSDQRTALYDAFEVYRTALGF